VSFASAFLDELEKVGARKRRLKRPKRPKRLKLTVPHLKVEMDLPAQKEEKKPRAKWGRRLGFILGRFLRKRVMAKQGVPAVRIK